MQVDDKVWFDATHKMQQVCHEVQVCSEGGQCVLVLAYFAETLAAVEAQLRDALIPYERFSPYSFDALCVPTGAAGVASNSLPAQDPGRVWLGLARSFQTANAPAEQDASATPVRIIIAEHHPRRTRDLEIIQSAASLSCEAQIGFHISLDDPLLTHLGGLSLRPLLEKLGMVEGECISHPLVTSAIRRAQEKIDDKVQRELPVESIADWFKYNLPQRVS